MHSISQRSFGNKMKVHQNLASGFITKSIVKWYNITEVLFWKLMRVCSITARQQWLGKQIINKNVNLGNTPAYGGSLFACLLWLIQWPFALYLCVCCMHVGSLFIGRCVYSCSCVSMLIISKTTHDLIPLVKSPPPPGFRHLWHLRMGQAFWDVRVWPPPVWP